MAVRVEEQGSRIGEVALVPFVEGDDEGEVQVCLEAIVSHRIVRFVEGGCLDGIVHEIDGLVEREESGY